mgnify:CR=1 FL=1
MSISLAEANDVLQSVFCDWVKQMELRATDIDGDRVRFLMPAADQFMRFGETLSGQAAMAIADTAMTVTLANALGGFKPVGTVDVSVSFMRPIPAGDIVCEGSILRLGRTMGFCQAVLRAAGDERAAIQVTGTYAIPPAASVKNG